MHITRGVGAEVKVAQIRLTPSCLIFKYRSDFGEKKEVQPKKSISTTKKFENARNKNQLQAYYLWLGNALILFKPNTTLGTRDFRATSCCIN